MTSRLVVLISGNGSNLQAILDSCASGELPASVITVISNKKDAYGLARAKNAKVEAIYFPKQENESRNEYDVRLAELITTKQPDYVILAGWMRILTSSFLSSFPNRVINLHPALPNTFPGTHAIERAFEAYQRGEIEHTGIMVHLVPDEGVDNGPVLATEIVPINKDDTLESIVMRVHSVEHTLLVKTLKRLINNNSEGSNITLDTSCVIPLLQLKDDQTKSDEMIALGKIKNAHNDGRLKIWVSQKSRNEAIHNLENAGNDFVRINKWVGTLRLFEELGITVGIRMHDVSRFDVDTVPGSDEQINEYNQIRDIVIGNKTSVKLGDDFDIAILFDHHLKKNDLFITLDKTNFRPTVVKQLFYDFGIQIVSPTQAIPILESEYYIIFD